MTEFIAKTDFNEVNLNEHSSTVCEVALIYLQGLGYNKGSITDAVKIAALSHDMGKTMRPFQEYMRNHKEVIIDEDDIELKKFPRHNEVSGVLLRTLAQWSDESYGKAIEDVIIYSTMYHHNTFNNVSTLGDLYTIEELQDVCDYFNELYKEYGVDHLIHLAVPEDLIPDAIEVGGESNFGLINPKASFVENRKIMSDFDIVFLTVRFADLCASQKRPSYFKKINNKTLSYSNYFDKVRWNIQKDIADRLYEMPYSILEAPVGFGKTLIGIRYLLNSEKTGFWVCPDNNLTISTYNNIKRLLDKCGNHSVEVSLLVGGKWLTSIHEEADIVVTNIDTYLNGIFRNSRKALSFKCISSNTIFDEYHEYMMSSSPLSALFVSMVEARKGMGNLKTLLMSGTMINGPHYMNFPENKVINADIEGNYGYGKDKKGRFHFISEEELYSLLEGHPKDTLIIHPDIKYCQETYKKYNTDFCIHSLFAEEDSERIIDEIFTHNGQDAVNEPSTVSSTSVMSRGYDVSFSKVILINPNPYMIEQSLGRLNRWDRFKIGDIYICISDKHLGIYKEVNPRNLSQKIYPLWDKIYKPYINELSKQYDNKVVSLDELKERRMKFLSSPEHSEVLIAKKNIENGFKMLYEAEIRKGNGISQYKGENDIKHSTDKMDVRGNEISRFFSIQIDGEPYGTLSGPVNIPSYRFGEDFLKLRKCGEIIENARKYLVSHPTEAEFYDITDRQLKYSTKLFDIMIDKAKSDNTPFIILNDYGYDKKFGFYKKPSKNSK